MAETFEAIARKTSKLSADERRAALVGVEKQRTLRVQRSLAEEQLALVRRQMRLIDEQTAFYKVRRGSQSAVGQHALALSGLDRNRQPIARLLEAMSGARAFVYRQQSFTPHLAAAAAASTRNTAAARNWRVLDVNSHLISHFLLLLSSVAAPGGVKREPSRATDAAAATRAAKTRPFSTLAAAARFDRRRRAHIADPRRPLPTSRSLHLRRRCSHPTKCLNLARLHSCKTPKLATRRLLASPAYAPLARADSPSFRLGPL